MTTTRVTFPPILKLPQVVKAVRTRARLVPVDVQQRALKTTAQFVALARQLFGQNFPLPSVAFDLRGKTAGLASSARNLLRFNAILLVENEADFHANLIPHEVAHLVANQFFGPGIASHGLEWKAVMSKFGVSPKRTHSYDVTNSAVGGVHNYVCNCGTVFQLGSRKHKQAARGHLFCKVCGATLRPQVVMATLRPVNAIVVDPTPTASDSLKAPVRQKPLTDAPPRLGVPQLPPVQCARPSPSESLATYAQLQQALVIADRLGIALLPEHIRSFAQCSLFLERHKLANPLRR